MEQEKASKLITLVQENESVRGRLEQAIASGDMNQARGELKAIAAEHNIDLSSDELDTIQEWYEERTSSRELGDEELDAVTGGGFGMYDLSPSDMTVKDRST